jgi:fucose permease
VQSESNSSPKSRRQSLLAVVLIEATILVAAGAMCALILLFQSGSRAAIIYPSIFFVGVNILGWISYGRAQNEGSKK